MKYLFILFAVCLWTNVYASHPDDHLYRFQDEDFVYRTIIDFFEKPVEAYTVYHDRLANNRYFGITAENIWEICDAGGLDIGTPAGSFKCKTFKNTLIQNNYKYHTVCKDKGKSGGTEHCVEDFYDIEVQYAQAKNLAIAWAKEKFNDDIVCNQNIRSGIRQDYVACASTKTKDTFYEFEFDDVKESGVMENKFIYREFARGLCLVYGGKPNFVVAKSEQVLREKLNLGNFDVTCKNLSCGVLEPKIKDFGYKTNSDGDNCKITYNKDNTQVGGRSDEYYAKFDGNTFTVYYKDKIFKQWKAVAGRGKTPQDPTPTICQDPIYQSCKSVGPTPSGRWFINQNDIQYLDNYGSGSYESIWWKPSQKGRQRTSYGPSRVLLNPYPDTLTYGRSHMYVHGGRFAGSSGCIDLIEKIDEFIDWFANQTEFSSMDVIVDYGNVTVCNNSCSENDKVCTPCRCISEDAASNGACEYK